MTKHNKKVILVGGGTGGHVVPIFEIYKKLKSLNKDLEIIVIGSGGMIEKQFFGSIPTYRAIQSGKLRRHITLKNIAEFCNFLIGMSQSFWILWRERPDLVFAKGGFVSLPVILAAKILRIPYFIHESDVEMGVANKISAKGAKKIFIGFPSMTIPKNWQNKLVMSGPIVRRELAEDRPKNREVFNFTNTNPIILITGGSLGALHINKTIAKIVSRLLPNYNIIHQAGSHSIGWMKEFRQSIDFNLRANYFLTDFLTVAGGIDQMLEAITLADLVITRAGANTVAELAVAGKAMILIPYKHASLDHQLKNARLLEQKGAAKIITDDELEPGKLLNVINQLFDNKSSELKSLREQSKKLFSGDGLQIVCQEIIDRIEKQ